MEIIHSVFLGVIQGLTEFLPISSDGHLVLVRHLLNWHDEGVVFDASLHMGTFFAVIVFYRKTWWRLIGTLFRRGSKADEVLLGLLIVSTIPGALLGFFASDVLEKYFRGMFATGCGFLFTAIILYVADRMVGKSAQKNDRPSLSQAVGIGFLQALALLPGVSRSGSTISGGIFSKLSKEKAVEFSFLMAMPITGGAGFLGILKSLEGPTALFWPTIGGFIISFLVGLWAINYFVKFVTNRKTFKPFVIYLLFVSVVSFVFHFAI